MPVKVSNQLTEWFSFAVDGPIARTVEDTALMLSVLAGPDSRSPICLPESGSIFLKSLERNLKGVRIAWSPDLGGLPVDSRVTETLEAQRYVFEDSPAERFVNLLEKLFGFCFHFSKKNGGVI